MPWISAFAEINVRLYVERDGKPGVWFLSLDATNPIAVWTARRFFHLPYRRAHIEMELRAVRDEKTSVPGDPAGAEYRYSSRLLGGSVRARFAGRYRATAPAHLASPGSLEHFLTERYCLYAAAPSGRLYRTEVHHPPWPLQMASGDVDSTDLLLSHGIEPGGPPDLLHFAKGVDVLTWAPEIV